VKTASDSGDKLFVQMTCECEKVVSILVLCSQVQDKIRLD